MLNVLVVDDEQMVGSSLQAIGSQFGISFCPVDTLEKAKEACRQNPPDAALIDWMLCDSVDGVAVAHQLRKIVPSIGIIIMSGCPLEQLQNQIEQLKDAVFLPKPSELESLITAIHEVYNG